MIEHKEKAILLFQSHFNETPHTFENIPLAGSDRGYMRLISLTHNALVAHNENTFENLAFVGFSSHFLNQGIQVPEVYAMSDDKRFYLLQDLGNDTLFERLQVDKKACDSVIKKTLNQLAKLQIVGHQNLDYSVCFNGQVFDQNAIMADLFYFKYYFLRPQKIIYNGQAIIKNFETLTQYLLEVENDFFMMRDCQSRNVMIHHENPFFIDYQGGKKGPLQYDVVSLLWQARAGFTPAEQATYIDYYCEQVSDLHPSFDVVKFKSYLPAFVFIRILQTLGSYGYRGLFERRQHFLKSIPNALINLKTWLANENLPIEINELLSALNTLTSDQFINQYQQQPQATSESQSPLTVYVNSFSYKQKIPDDTTGNGGGFVFDCRIIYNPGRHDEYKKLTGRDEAVKNYIEQHTIMPQFLHHTKALVNEGVKTYIERGFDSLQINFGCTGGQHRSVFAADAIAKHLKEKFGVQVVLHHIEQEKKNWIN